MKKSNVLRFTNEKETDNIETVEGLNETVKDWLETLSGPFDASTEIENFEFRSRDGFSAHSHNKGGLDLITISDIAVLMGSGEHIRLSIGEWVEKQWDDTRIELIKDNPEMDHESDEFQDLLYSASCNEYDCIAWRVRVMYEGNGVLRIYAGYDKDAPYFRWGGKTDFETEIHFKTISGLERKLKALTKKVEGAQ